MAPRANTRPIIIKRRKVVAKPAHHGGAWKVAYADFVTAMMAFFMLMWLLNATTERQRKGLADYFSPNIPIVRISGGGDGAFGGDSLFTEETTARSGTGATAANPTASEAAAGIAGAGAIGTEGAAGDASGLAMSEEPEEDRGDGGFGSDGVETADGAEEVRDDAAQAGLRGIGEALAGLGGDSLLEELALQHVQTRLTDEGLVVEVHALPGQPLFDAAEAPTPILRQVVGVVGDVFAAVENSVAVEAHVPARALRRDPEDFVRTADRADAVRALLAETRTTPERVVRLTGHADREPAVPDPFAVRNDRVVLILLRSDL